VIGSEGMVSLAALRWLADQDVAFSMLERDGKVLAVTGPVRSSDAKLRRAQALAHSSGAALRITRELISQKLVHEANEGHVSRVTPVILILINPNPPTPLRAPACPSHSTGPSPSVY
jgi:hypothetical protein